MSAVEFLSTDVRTWHRDLPDSALEKAGQAGLIGWDIETSGFDWSRDRIGTCQIFIPPSDIFVVQVCDDPCRQHPNLETLLSNNQVRKVFHHAIFDLRFMISQWGATIRNVACTKIASKILNPSDEEDHTLKSVLQKHLGIQIEKELGNSDWLREHLTDEQIHYAAQDVMHLTALLEKLQSSLEAVSRWHLAEKSFAYLPTRATLDISGAGDVFRYE